MSVLPTRQTPVETFRGQTWIWMAVLGLAVALGVVLKASGQGFYVSMLSRMLIWGLAACSLNLVLGYGGLVSFGHAAYLGLGAYATGILMTEGVQSGWIHLLISMGAAGLFAALVGALSLRTRGVYFIMITLAFAQMAYYLVLSVKAYGGDEGLTLKTHSQFGLGLDLKNELTLYLLVLAVLAASLWTMHRLMASRFGRVIRASRDDGLRAQAIGYPVFLYQLALFVVSGMLAGVAGMLMANQQSYVSPNLMQWTQSGMLMVMVILGGVGRLTSGVWGAVALLLLEDVLADHTEHWSFFVGWALLAVVLFAPSGLAAILDRLGAQRAGHRHV
jgi:branched-chain amino acid transport system permease protein